MIKLFSADEHVEVEDKPFIKYQILERDQGSSSCKSKLYFPAGIYSNV